MSAVQIASVLGAALLVTLSITPLVRAVSLRFGLVDQPGGRKVHETATSRLGGVAIFLGFAAAMAVQLAGEFYLEWPGGLSEARTTVLGCLAGMAVVFAVGLIDDIITLSPGVKLLGQIAGATVVILAGLRIEFVGNPMGGGLIMLGLVSIPVTVIYIVAFTNVINLIDGLDGLAAGVSAIAAISLLALALQSNQPDAALFAAALIGACLGFLRHNFNPASIFMGDSGSMLLGFALAAISLLGIMKSVAAIALAVPLLIIGVPIFDTASAIIRRLRHNRPIQEADKGHIHHRLLHRGFDQRQTVLIIYVWSAALAVGGWAVRWAATPVKLLAFVLLAVLTAVMVSWLGLFEAAHHHAEESHGGGEDEEPLPGPKGPLGSRAPGPQNDPL